MARIRNVKPEFFIDPELQDIEKANPGHYIMLTYEGLWTQCSKNGVFLYDPRVLHLYILPFLDFDIGKTLTILCDSGFIHRFQSGGKKYGYIPTFAQHQTISGQEQKQAAKYPDYAEGSDWEVIDTVLGSEREVRGKADLGHRTLDIGHRTKDAGGAREGDDALVDVLEPETVTTPTPPPVPYHGKQYRNQMIDAIRKIFEQYNPQGFTEPATEYAACVSLADRFIRLGRDDPIAFGGTVISTFRDMITGSRDKFWNRQPLTPSSLNKTGIFDQVLAEIRRLESAGTGFEEFEK